MKTTLLVSLFGVFAAPTLCAQPEITFSDMTPVAGSSQTIVSSNYVDPGAAGENQTWDLSTMTNNGQTTQLIELASAAPDAASYPSATHVNIVNDLVDAYSFIRFDDNIAEIIALTLSTGQSNEFVNPRTQLEFPVIFGNIFTDTYERVDDYGFPGLEGGEEGSLTATVDGYGTLITPTATYTDVLRVHYVVESTVTSPGTPDDFPFSEDIYVFFKSGYSSALATSSISSFAGAVTESSSYLLSDNAVSVGELPFGVSEVSLFPNPSVNDFSIAISTGLSTQAEISILSLDGRVVQATAGHSLPSGNSQINFDVSDLAPGIYIVQVDFADALVTRKLIVQ